MAARSCKELTFPIKTDFAFLKLAPSFSYSGASFLQWPHLSNLTQNAFRNIVSGYTSDIHNSVNSN